jgi:hypothetical protein
MRYELGFGRYGNCIIGVGMEDISVEALRTLEWNRNTRSEE